MNNIKNQCHAVGKVLILILTAIQLMACDGKVLKISWKSKPLVELHTDHQGPLYVAYAEDSEGLRLDYFLPSAPEGWSIDQNTGEISSQSLMEGHYVVVVEARSVRRASQFTVEFTVVKSLLPDVDFIFPPADAEYGETEGIEIPLSVNVTVPMPHKTVKQVFAVTEKMQYPLEKNAQTNTLWVGLVPVNAPATTYDIKVEYEEGSADIVAGITLQNNTNSNDAAVVDQSQYLSGLQYDSETDTLYYTEGESVIAHSLRHNTKKTLWTNSDPLSSFYFGVDAQDNTLSLLKLNAARFLPGSALGGVFEAQSSDRALSQLLLTQDSPEGSSPSSGNTAEVSDTPSLGFFVPTAKSENIDLALIRIDLDEQSEIIIKDDFEFNQTIGQFLFVDYDEKNARFHLTQNIISDDGVSKAALSIDAKTGSVETLLEDSDSEISSLLIADGAENYAFDIHFNLYGTANDVSESSMEDSGADIAVDNYFNVGMIDNFDQAQRVGDFSVPYLFFAAKVIDEKTALIPNVIDQSQFSSNASLGIATQLDLFDFNEQKLIHSIGFCLPTPGAIGTEQDLASECPDGIVTDIEYSADKKLIYLHLLNILIDDAKNKFFLSRKIQVVTLSGKVATIAKGN